MSLVIAGCTAIGLMHSKGAMSNEVFEIGINLARELMIYGY